LLPAGRQNCEPKSWIALSMSPFTERQPKNAACTGFRSTGRAACCESVPHSRSMIFMVTPTCLR